MVESHTLTHLAIELFSNVCKLASREVPMTAEYLQPSSECGLDVVYPALPGYYTVESPRWISPSIEQQGFKDQLGTALVKGGKTMVGVNIR